jgi:acetyl esterase/lipase
MNRGVLLSVIVAGLAAGCGTMEVFEEETTAQEPVQTAPVEKKFTMTAITYKKGLDLDLYIPEAPTDAFRVAAPELVILIHGGGWSTGERSDLAEVAEFFAQRHFAVATISYRLSPAAYWPAPLEDARAAVKFLKSKSDEYGYSTRHIIAGGESAGGHLSMWLGVKGDVSTVLSISGLHDLSIKITPEGESYKIVQKALGPKYPAGIKAFSPLNFVTKNMCQTFFIHGQKDPWVQFEHSQVAHKKLEKLGVRTKLSLVPGMGHGIKPSTDAEKFALEDFIEWYENSAPIPASTPQ